jgi:hypothetical protein
MGPSGRRGEEPTRVIGDRRRQAELEDVPKADGGTGAVEKRRRISTLGRRSHAAWDRGVGRYRLSYGTETVRISEKSVFLATAKIGRGEENFRENPGRGFAMAFHPTNLTVAPVAAVKGLDGSWWFIPDALRCGVQSGEIRTA